LSSKNLLFYRGAKRGHLTQNNTLNVSYLPPYKVQKRQINFFLLKTWISKGMFFLETLYLQAK